MAALHRSNWETPTPFYGFEVALRFFAPTHQAKPRTRRTGFALLHAAAAQEEANPVE